jgi:glycosyltransferase involved in cell wall biosynthesis
VVHIVTTPRFAGVERYVSQVARESAARGWVVTVVGGEQRQVRATAGDAVHWLPGSTPARALASLARLGPQDVCHAHMTTAEAVAVASSPLHRAPIVSTRHFAAQRGSRPLGRLLAPWIARRLTRQIAVSEFVAARTESRPDAVIANGVALSPCVWRPDNRTVLVLQRLEAEKETEIALRAWQVSRLVEEGWKLRVVGDGSLRPALEAWTRSAGVEGVTFAGWAQDVERELRHAGMLIAPASADSFGFGVVEAMSAGVPVIASAAGGHLETVGRLPEPVLFRPGNADDAARAMRKLLANAARRASSEAGRELVATEFTIERHVDRLLNEYARAAPSVRRRLRPRASIR